MPTRTRDFRFAPASHAPDAARGLRRRRARSVAAWLLLGVSVVAMQASSQTLSGSVIAGGGGRSTSSGGCFRLDATIGQPLAGVANGGTFTIFSGFLPGRADRDSIFNYGFEVCS